MINQRAISKLLTFLIAAVWLVNGLFCKVLNLVPRHQLIVARILGNEHAVFLTKTIGVAEVLMAVWIMSRITPRLSAITQIVIVVTMNIIELLMASDLLLFGKVNAILAVGFVFVVYCNEFVINKKPVQLSYASFSEK